MSLEPKNSSKPSPLHNRHHNHYPRTMNHVAVSVLDLDKAIRWYTKVLGFNLVKEPMEGISDDTHIGRLFQDVFGQGFRKLRLAHLSFGNQVGFEIFEFIEPKEEQRQNNFEYWKTGFFHICITDPNIEEITKRIVESGGKQRSKIWELTPGKPYKVVSCEDPFGNVIDIYSHGYEYIWRSEGYSK
jgi:catechol 2,3-dioxygenase-like lactoylglutathione lyase family enzyme